MNPYLLVPRLETNLHGHSWPSTSNPYHYKAFRLKVNQVGKYSTSWSLLKLQLFGVHKIPLRAPTLVLELSNLDRQKAGKSFFSLSLFIIFLPFSLYELLPFLFLFSFSFFPFLLFYSFLFSHLIFSSFLLLISPFSLHFLSLFGATTHSVKRRKFPPLLPQAKCVASQFPFFFLYFIIPLYDIMLSCGSL